MTISQTTNIWIKDPTVLLKKNQLNQIWPKSTMSRNEKINAITRLVIVLSLLGFLITQSVNFFVTGGITLGVIILLYYAKDFKKDSNVNKDIKVREGFTNPKVYQAMKSEFTNPTNKNPLMNVLLPEIADDPHRKRAAGPCPHPRTPV